MDDKLVDLQINKLIQEYSFLKSDEDFKKELVNINQSIFLGIINDELTNIDPSLLKIHENKEQESKNKSKINIDELSHNDKIKLKKIYRDIVKLTHPDKINDEELNEIYLKAVIAYETYDLFELYFIANSLKIKVKLTLDETKILNSLIEYKKEEITIIEQSFIWLWINAETEIDKENLVKKFIKSHYLI